MATGDVFHALGEATRRAIIDHLAEQNGQTLYEICVRRAMKSGVALSRQAISKHLAVLEEAGLIGVQWDGRSKRHYLERTALREVARWVNDHLEQGNSREDLQ